MGKYGLVDLYARTLRATEGLSKRDAETTVARRLCPSPYFKGVFPKHTVPDETAPILITHQHAFTLLVECLRAIDGTGGKNFHLAPLVGPARRFLFLDSKQLQLMYQHHPELRSPDGPPTCVADVFNVASPRKGFELGASVRTDGIQFVARWEKPFMKQMTMSSAKHAQWAERQQAKAALAAQYSDQQRRLAAGEKLAKGEAKINGLRVRSKRKYEAAEPVVHSSGLLTSKRGLFSHTAIPKASTKALPTIV